MSIQSVFAIASAVILFSFSGDKTTFEFGYPNNKEATFIMSTDKFKKFEKEWRGSDYYYLGEGKDGFICSVLFYKLNAGEMKNLVDVPRQIAGIGPESSPAYPLMYFLTYSPTKKFETNEQKWGGPSNEFMFSQADIKEVQGKKINQKNMHAYAMFGKDLFVNVHVSKGDCSAADSIAMRELLEGLKIKK